MKGSAVLAEVLESRELARQIVEKIGGRERNRRGFP